MNSTTITDTKWFRYCFGIFVATAGTLVTCWFGREVLLYHDATAHFLPVQARILSHNLGQKKIITNAGEGYTDTPLITYEYTVDGLQYRADSVFPRPTYYADDDWAKSFFDEFPIGSTQTAHYDPQQPGKAYLCTTRLNTVNYVFLCTGLLFLFLGGGSTIQMLWRDLRG